MSLISCINAAKAESINELNTIIEINIKMDGSDLKGRMASNESNQQFNFTQKYNEMCKSRLVAFFNECNKTYTNSDSEIKAVLDRLAAQGKSEGNKHGRKLRHAFNKRGNKMFHSESQSNTGELNDQQKIKVVSTLSEFVWLNRNFKPTQFNFIEDIKTLNTFDNVDSGVIVKRLINKEDYRFEARDPFNQLNKSKINMNAKESAKCTHKFISETNSKMWDDFGSLFYQDNSTNLVSNQNSNKQFVIKINDYNDFTEESSQNTFSVLNSNKSLENFNRESMNNDNCKTKNTTNNCLNRELEGNPAFNKISEQKHNFLFSSKIMYKNKRVASVQHKEDIRKSQSNVETLAVIQEDLTSKTTANISRINSTSFSNNKQGAKGVLISYPSRINNKVFETHTTQHKSSKLEQPGGGINTNKFQMNLKEFK